jgi:hypothetical protein
VCRQMPPRTYSWRPRGHVSKLSCES